MGKRPRRAHVGTDGRTLSFNSVAASMNRTELSDEGVAFCGPPMHADTGLFEMELLVSNMFSLDDFCRVDIGIAQDPNDPRRCGSGMRWEAGDGDVFMGDDAVGWDGANKSGWMGDTAPIVNGRGALP